MNIKLSFDKHIKLGTPNEQMYEFLKEGIYVNKKPLMMLVFLIFNLELNKFLIKDMIDSFRNQDFSGWKNYDQSAWFTHRYLGTAFFQVETIYMVLDINDREKFYEIFPELLI